MTERSPVQKGRETRQFTIEGDLGVKEVRERSRVEFMVKGFSQKRRESLNRYME